MKIPAFFLTSMQTNLAAWKRAAPPHRREGNTKPSALLATAGCEGRLSKYCGHSESKPILAVGWGKVAKRVLHKYRGQAGIGFSSLSSGVKPPSQLHVNPNA